MQQHTRRCGLCVLVIQALWACGQRSQQLCLSHHRCASIAPAMRRHYLVLLQASPGLGGMAAYRPSRTSVVPCRFSIGKAVRPAFACAHTRPDCAGSAVRFGEMGKRGSAFSVIVAQNLAIQSQPCVVDEGVSRCFHSAEVSCCKAGLSNIARNVAADSSDACRQARRSVVGFDPRFAFAWILLLAPQLRSRSGQGTFGSIVLLQSAVPWRGRRSIFFVGPSRLAAMATPDDLADMIDVDALGLGSGSGGQVPERARPIGRMMKMEVKFESSAPAPASRVAQDAGLASQSGASAPSEREVDEDQMFLEAFPEPTLPGANPSSGSGSGVRCALCGSKGSDKDLADPDPNSQRPTPFLRPNTEFVACEHCVMLLRYQDMPTKTVSSVVQSFSERPGARLDFVARLAMYLAMKSTKFTAKVHQVTLSKHMDLLQAVMPIEAALLLRMGVDPVEAGCFGASPPARVVGLKDYMKAYGNPLCNNEALVQGVVNDEWQVLVQTSRPLGSGRTPLQSVVQAVAQGVKSDPVGVLSRMSVDTMDAARLVRCMVAEYVCREDWRVQVDSLRQPPSAGRDHVSSHSSMSGQTAQLRAEEASAVDDIAGHDELDDEGDATEESLGMPRSVPHQEVAVSAAASLSHPLPGTVARTPRKRFSASASDVGSSLPSPVVQKAAFDDKKVDMFGKRVFEFCKAFAPAGCGGRQSPEC